MIFGGRTKSQQGAPAQSLQAPGEARPGRVAELSDLARMAEAQLAAGAEEPVCPRGEPGTYRLMRKNPTLTLARAVFGAPIYAAGWSVDSVDEDVELTELEWAYVSDMSTRLRDRFLEGAMQAIEYGFKPLEIVWESRSGRLVVDDLKPLCVEKTEAKLNELGKVIAAKNFDVTLERPYFCWLTIDAEDDNPAGRSRYENVRETAWWGWQTAMRRQMEYMRLVSCPTPMITFPPGQSPDASGAMTSNYELAVALGQKLRAGKPIHMPNVLAAAAMDLLERGVPIEKVQAWVISFLEASGSHGSEFIETLRYWDSLMMRGYLTPERVATEGQAGTKAEAGVHAQIAVQVAQQTLSSLMRQLNEQVVKPALEANFGFARAKLVAESLTDDVLDAMMQIFIQALSGNPTLLETWIDVDAVLDRLKWPRPKEPVAGEEPAPGAEPEPELGGEAAPSPGEEPEPEPEAGSKPAGEEPGADAA